jgi:hypothetical protein
VFRNHERRRARANGATERTGGPHDGPPRGRLRAGPRGSCERRRALLADVAAIDVAMAACPDPGPPSNGGASSTPGHAKRPGRPRSPTSRASRVLRYVSTHPGATTGDVARALRQEGGDVAGALFELRRSGRVVAFGERPNVTWSAGLSDPCG